MSWIKTTDKLPERNVVVETKMDDFEGTSKNRKLKLIGCLWYTPDEGMYVYYSPTHWRPVKDLDEEKILQERT